MLDAVLDVLVRPDVFALAVVLAHELVQQPAVHVVADAERENPGVELVEFLGVGHDLHFVGLAGGGQAVGQEDHVAGPFGVLNLGQCDAHGGVDVGAAAGVEPLDEAQRRLARVLVEPLQLGPEGLDLIVVGHDVEQIALVQIVQHVLQGRPHLLDFRAGHAARAVDHENHGFRLLFRGRGFPRVGRGQQGRAWSTGALPPSADGTPALPSALISGLASSRK